MASSPLPSTPRAVSAPTPTADQSRTPGKWRHPQLDEIVRRQNARTFGDQNIRSIVWNTIALVAVRAYGDTVQSYSSSLLSTLEPSAFFNFLRVAVQLLFLSNIALALSPLVRSKDDLSDIPLTPTQRSLLGLDPSTTSPLTPGSTYITPPKYRLSASRTASSASKAASPLSASTSPSGRRLSSGASFSPSPSPLFHKAVSNGGRDNGRRPSFGSSTSFGRSSLFGESTMSSIAPATPSPVGGKRVSLGLSNKWLYERSRRLSASNGSL
ncbi:nuclear pore complex component [Aspergillus steynii IBT 23096]|uniref:Nuclear pore complex component n=1 Tax=Aspergillus steynii IBT 23096 TaxID=1392250 RepID=A0A2I2FZH3_9EURO|nr:nuclear pore complex component [Aspergillus steynii IBT 23096]PLB45966.1 nuclear pore complex component [Aspergillus steynii IBT 23096]